MKISLLILLFILVITPAGCSNSEETESEDKSGVQTKEKASKKQEEKKDSTLKRVIAVVNGQPIHGEDLMDATIEGAVDNELLYQEAVEMGYEEKYSDEIRRLKKKLFASKLKDKIKLDYLENNPITPEEIKSYYEENKDDFTKLSLIMVATRGESKAEEISEILRQQKEIEFEKLKEEFKEKGYAVRRLNSTDRYNKHFDKMEKGAVTQVRGRSGRYYVYAITEVKVPDDLDNIYNYVIPSLLKKQRYDTALNEHLKMLRKDSEIDVKIDYELKDKE